MTFYTKIKTMSRSIYGSNKGSRPIYGISKKMEAECVCLPEVSPIIGLQLLNAYLENLKITIDRFYNSAFGIAPVVANMSMRAVVPTPVLMRINWVKENPGVKFDKTNLAHRDGLKFIYNLNNRDWRQDPLFKALGET